MESHFQFLVLAVDPFGGAKKRRSGSTLSPSALLGALSLSKGKPRPSGRGVEGLTFNRIKHIKIDNDGQGLLITGIGQNCPKTRLISYYQGKTAR
jgi:hypothetical protein